MLTKTPTAFLLRQHRHAGEVSSLQTVFTQGDCWRLAIALSDLLDRPLAFVIPRGDEMSKTDSIDWVTRKWCHAVVQIDDNAFLDINGIHTSARLLRTWSRIDPGWIYSTQDQIHLLTRGMTPTFGMRKGTVSRFARELCSALDITLPAE